MTSSTIAGLLLQREARERKENKKRKNLKIKKMENYYIIAVVAFCLPAPSHILYHLYDKVHGASTDGAKN